MPDYRHAHGRSRRAGALAAALVAAVALAPALASAQQNALEEVVVTARKRTENLQNVPIAVSAFTAKEINRAGITNLTDFNIRVPNMELQSGNGVNGDANIYIRGMGQRETKVNLDSGVGVYVDGVYIARASGALFNISDVESVQVLRGPQGTLFGRNSTGGAVVIKTKLPTNKVEGFATVRGGSRNLVSVDGALNLPLIKDKLMTRLSLASVKQDGYMHNMHGGPDFNNTDQRAAIWKLRWLATDNLTADLEYTWEKVDQLPRGQKCLFTNHTGHPKYAASGVEMLGLDYKAACEKVQKAGNYDFDSELRGGYRAENKGLSLTLNWQLGEVNVKSISAWRRTVSGYEEDLDATGLDVASRLQNLGPGRDGVVNQYSQELQVAGHLLDQRIDYVGGIYAFHEEADRDRKIGIEGDNTVTTSPPFLGVQGWRARLTARDTNNSAYSAYTQWSFHATDWFEFTGGLRYTRSYRKLKVHKWRVDPASTGGTPLALGIYLPPPGGTINRTFDFIPADDPVFASQGIQGDARSPYYRYGSIIDDAWTPMASIQFFLPNIGVFDGGNVYFTYSQGFRSGGLAEDGDDVLTAFHPEKVKNYEFGFKGQFFGARLRTNLAVFYDNYENQQITTERVGATSADISGTVVNAGASDIRGVELELTAVPVTNLQITFNYAYNDGKYTDFKDTVVETFPRGAPGTGNCLIGIQYCPVEVPGVDRSDEPMPRLPQHTYFIAAQYTIDTSVGQFIPRIEYSRKEDISYHFDRSSFKSGAYFVNSQNLTNARLTWISPQNAWQLVGWVKNLTDEHFYTGGVPFNDPFGGGGVIPTAPRTYGMDVTFRW